MVFNVVCYMMQITMWWNAVSGKNILKSKRPKVLIEETPIYVMPVLPWSIPKWQLLLTWCCWFA